MSSPARDLQSIREAVPSVAIMSMKMAYKRRWSTRRRQRRWPKRCSTRTCWTVGERECTVHSMGC